MPQWSACLAALIVLLALPAHAERKFVGTSIPVTWTAATGPVAGYEVWVNGQWSHNVLATSATVSRPLGEEFTVRVRAFSSVSALGPPSDASEPAKFYPNYDGNGDGRIATPDLWPMWSVYGLSICGNEYKPGC